MGDAQLLIHVKSRGQFMEEGRPRASEQTTAHGDWNDNEWLLTSEDECSDEAIGAGHAVIRSQTKSTSTLVATSVKYKGNEQRN
jgi:hypothetical protein